MWGARIVVTAATAGWARHAARSLTGLRDVGDRLQVRGGDRARARRGRDARRAARASPRCCSPPTRTGWPSGSSSASARPCSRARRRPASTASRPRTTVDVGGQLRFFGDGWQASKVLDGRRYWRVPVMEGEFLVRGALRDRRGRRRREHHHPRPRTRRARCARRRRRPPRCARCEGVIMPFPGGIARSGSKVGSRYRRSMASTNHELCPTLRAQVDDTPGARGHRLGVRDRDRRARGRAGARGDARRPRGGGAGGGAAGSRPATTAATSGRTTSRSRTSSPGVGPLTLTLREAPAAPVDAEALGPDRLAA